MKAGIKGAAIGLGLGLVATVITFKRSPTFQTLSKPLQSTFIVAGTATGFMFGADRAITQFTNRELGYMDEEMYSHLQKTQDLEHAKRLSSFDKALSYLNANRWSVIGATWLASMVGALGYTFSNKYLSTQQKLVQARMYAQAATIAVLMASAGLSIYLGDDGKKFNNAPDAQLRAVLELPDDRVPEEKSVHKSS
ncbi:hypothetical protein DM01DRAFT_1340177 [Hesseltinella vesiculosa]|uniref:HIG1 domain-containing protein n=1 Tax=Hesseltinella vesiculosa TaxID=101127 RepID=A0A1X2G4X1_9FUNG|nr:hypothetical protein DM01DRAFT_1340177 [Hesseltinella vesiculosa]